MDKEKNKKLDPIEERKRLDIKLAQYKKYLSKDVTLAQLKKLEKISDGISKLEEDKVLKNEVFRIIVNDSLKTTSFLKNVPDLQNDLTKLPKRTKLSFRERIIDGILSISINNYLTYSPLGLQQYVGVEINQIKKWLEEEDINLGKDEKKTSELWKMLKYKFEFNQGKAIAKENIKNFNINPNMFDFGLGASILSSDETYEGNEIPFDEFTIDKQTDKINEWDEFEKNSHVEKPLTHVEKPLTHVKNPLTHVKNPLTHVKNPLTHVEKKELNEK